jgi:predicted  nucleic acid-binding Zn-ribbon protein
VYAAGSKELLEGCNQCGSHFFFYIRDDQFKKLMDQSKDKGPIIDIPKKEKKVIEKDIREMAGITDEKAPVILDFESVRAIGEGKFEIDIVNLFRKDRPLIYKLEEGKYIIDLASTLGQSLKNLKEIKDPNAKK